MSNITEQIIDKMKSHDDYTVLEFLSKLKKDNTMMHELFCKTAVDFADDTNYYHIRKILLNHSLMVDIAYMKIYVQFIKNIDLKFGVIK